MTVVAGLYTSAITPVTRIPLALCHSLEDDCILLIYLS
jgi:hypothetical protein